MSYTQARNNKTLFIFPDFRHNNIYTVTHTTVFAITVNCRRRRLPLWLRAASVRLGDGDERQRRASHDTKLNAWQSRRQFECRSSRKKVQSHESRFRQDSCREYGGRCFPFRFSSYLVNLAGLRTIPFSNRSVETLA